MEMKKTIIRRKRLHRNKHLNRSVHLNSSLPLIHSSQFKFFETKQNLSNISNYFYNEDEQMVKQLDIENTNQNASFCLKLNKDIYNRRNILIKIPSQVASNKKPDSALEEVKIKEQRRRIQLERIKIIHKETELKKSLSNLKLKLEHGKAEKERINNQIITLLKENEERKLKLETLNVKPKQNKESLYTSSNSNRDDNINNSNNNININHKSSSKLNYLKTLKKEFAMLQDNKYQIHKEIQTTITTVNDLRNKLQQIKDNYSKIKLQMQSEKKELLQHYHNLLYEGIDTRQEGLSWIIRAIWDQNEEVSMNYLPNFLDQKAINYLFDISHKYKTLHKLKEKIAEIMKESAEMEYRPLFGKEVKCTRQKLINSRSVLDLRNTKNSIEFMKEMKKIYEKKNDKNNYTFKKITFNWEDDKNEPLLRNANMIKMLEKKVEMLIQEIHVMKEKEMERITKEFMDNEYEKRFQVTQDVVISTLIGEENKNAEFAKQQKIKREIIQNIKKCSFFTKYNQKPGKM